MIFEQEFIYRFKSADEAIKYLSRHLRGDKINDIIEITMVKINHSFHK